MIDLYTWSTPNGRKISILLNELDVEYRVIPIDITKGDQFSPEFTAISPNGKIPAIVDHDIGLALMESAAIMIHLADKYGKFLPAQGLERMRVLQWLIWQVAGFGPSLGQAHHFMYYNPGVSEYTSRRLEKEVKRLYGVLDHELGLRQYIAEEYSIADMAIWPWVARHKRHGVDLGEFSSVRRWYNAIRTRPQVVAGFHVPHFEEEVPEA